MVHIERGIIIPTFKDHFNKNITFLKSVRKNISDAKETHIRFITSNESETSELLNLFQQSAVIDMADVVSLPSMLSEYQVSKKESRDLLSICSKLGQRQKKYSYQAIKKLYGVKHLDAKETLVLDSECIVIKKTSFKELFSNYLNNPIVFISNQCASDYDSPGGNRFNEQALKFVDKDLSSSHLIRKWLWEYQGWFFQKDIVNDFFNFVENHHGMSAYEFMRDNRNIWEAVSYWWFIYLRQDKYSYYRFLNAEDEIKSVFSNEEKSIKYLNEYLNRDHGIVEFLPFALTDNNFKEIKSFYDKFNLNFIRIEPYNAYGDIEIQKRLINECESIKLIVCSEHANKHWSF